MVNNLLSVLEESLKQLKPDRCPTTGWAARSSSADLSLIRGWPISGRPTPALPGSLMKSFGIWTPALVLAVDMDQFCSSVHATVTPATRKVAARIAELRHKQGMSQEALAKKAHINR